MKIHSDTLTVQDILDAAPEGCYLPVFNHGNFGRTRVGVEGSRSRSRGYVVRLCGSSKYAPRNLPGEKSATWDEWGIFIAELFRRDPAAIIGVYKSRDDFIFQTTQTYNRAKLYRPDLGIKAPWLAHN